MKKIFTLFAVAVMAFAAQANVLTVCDGEATNDHAPLYGLYSDTQNTMVQMIYTADMLTDMVNGQISQVKFFCADADGISSNLSGAVIQLAVKEVEQDAFTEGALEAVAGTTVVATTTIAGGETELVFDFNEPFEYTGGNLLIETLVTTPASFKTVNFYGVETEAVSSLFQYVWATWAGPSVNANYFLPKAEFAFEAGQAPVDPAEKTDAPSSTKENYVYNDGNLYYNAYTVTLIETEPSTIYYRVGILTDGEYVYGEWMEYTGELDFNEEGTYMIEAYAIADGKTESDHIWDGFTVSKMVDVEELFAGKSVASVRYFNLAGQEMQQANGLIIMVTTFTDGTTSAVKVVK